jgi:hypothetical protein
MNRYLPLLAAGGLTFAVCLAQPPEPAAKATPLPLTRVTLTNAGIGYFHREGTIDGDARVELKVNEEDVNDLILTLLADDPTGTGKAVVYDNRAPADITLKAFSIDLTENPGLGHLLHQVRGEKVTITTDGKTTTTGSIVSIDRPKGEVIVERTEREGEAKTVTTPVNANGPEQLTLLTDEGLETLSVPKITRVKFVKPELQAEFRKALEALAAARGEAKKSVSVQFRGKGQRKVSVGYVADAPLWKPTYRLSAADGKATLECLAAIENTTDADWENVKVTLVSGRPVTFKMDLYDPLYVPRPTFEPEMYASLRPPLYQGQGSGFGNLGGQLGLQGGAQFNGGFGGGNLGVGGGILGVNGGLNQNLSAFGSGLGYGVVRGTTRYQYGGVTRESVRSLLRPMGVQANPDEPTKPRTASDLPSVAEAKHLGEAFSYSVADPVTLPRFKSALVPVIRETVPVRPLSVYNPAIHPTYPLKGFHVTNSTKQFLAQGPLTVYDGGTAVGQARIADVKPGDTRLVAYAIDLDVPVRMDPLEDKRTPVSRKLVAGELRTVTRVRATVRYSAFNKGKQPVTVWLTQAARPEWKLISPAKPAEQTPDLFRFELVVPAGEKATLEVVEELDEKTTSDVWTLYGDTLDTLAKEAITPPAVKAALVKVRAVVAERDAAAAGIKAEEEAVKGVVDEQNRLRANLAAVPKESEAYKRYVKKFDEQETDIETRRAKIKEHTRARDKAAKELTELTRGLNAE